MQDLQSLIRYISSLQDAVITLQKTVLDMSKENEQINANNLHLLEKLINIESKIESLQYGNIKPIEEQDGFILSDLLNADK